MSIVGEARARKRALLQRQATTEAQLTRQWVATRETLLRDLSTLTTQIDEARQRGEAVSQAWLTRQHRYQALLSQITAQVDGYARAAAGVVSVARTDAALTGAQDGSALLDAATPSGVTWTYNALPTHAVAQIAGRLRTGQPLETLFHGWGAAASAEAQQALFTGVALGWSPAQTARMLSRTLDSVSYARALTIARTETLGAWRDAQIATYRANDDVVGAWLWSAEKGPNTCAMCLAMDGTRHSLDESLDSHPCCRCSALPITKSWSEILGSVGVSADGIRETNIAATYQPGGDWFAAQSAETQRRVLGPAKYAAFSSGKLSLDDLVGVSHDRVWGTGRYEKSLKQLGMNAADLLAS